MNSEPIMSPLSILGPTLFLLFISDLPLYLKHCLADLNADDSTFHVSGKNKPDIERKLQPDANETNDWSIRNNLSIHYGKSTTMTLGSRHNINKLDNLTLLSMMSNKSQSALKTVRHTY